MGWTLLVVGVLIILALACYAIWLWRQVWRREQEMQVLRHRTEASLLDQMDIVCRALVQGQMNVTEGALRLEALLDKLTMRPPEPLDLAAIHQLAADATGFDIGAARNALEAHERRAQDAARQQLESAQEAAVVASARRLLESLPAWRLHLQLAS